MVHAELHRRRAGREQLAALHGRNFERSVEKAVARHGEGCTHHGGGRLHRRREGAAAAEERRNCCGKDTWTG
jgi:hypothetical protein